MKLYYKRIKFASIFYAVSFDIIVPMSNKKRIDYFDLARGVGIIFVILGHIEYIPQGLRTYIVSFHMPLFFVISGMLLMINKEEERDIKSLISGKINSILKPYLYFSVIDIIVYIIYFLITGRDGGWQTVLMDIIQSVTLYGMSVLWFLPALFISELLLIIILKKFKKLSPIILLVIFLIALFVNDFMQEQNLIYGNSAWFAVIYMIALMIIRALICLFFVALGFFFAGLWSRLPSVSPTIFTVYSSAADLLIGINFLIVVFFLSRINPSVDLHYCVFGNPFIFFLTAVVGSLGLIFTCKSTELIKNRKLVFPLKYLGKNSLIIMLTHLDFYILYVSEVFAMHFNKYISDEFGAPFNIMIVTFVLIAEVFVIEIINRFFPFLIGKSGFSDKKKRASAS